MEDSNEIWQVEVKGEIFESSFAELTQWIAEDSLIEVDKVRRGNLRWLEAGRVPPLRPFFEAKKNGTEPPAVQSTVVDGNPDGVIPTNSTQNFTGADPSQADEDAQDEFSEAPDQFAGIDNQICAIHPELDSEYLCEACGHGFCKQCPEGFGTSVKICPYCGAMCRSKNESVMSEAYEGRIRQDIDNGFGFDDLVTAFKYPFRFKGSLFFGSALVAVLAYGRAAAGLGSIFFIAAGLICAILSTAFVFGMLSNTLNRFAAANIDSNFLPEFEDFSAWDDVIHPFLLFLGSWFVSFGPALVVPIVMVWYAVSSFAGAAQQVNGANDPLAVPASTQTVNHIDIVKKKLVSQNQGRTDIKIGPDGLTDAQRNTLSEEAEFLKINDLANNYRQEQVKSTVGPTNEEQQAQMYAIGQQVIKSAGVFLILILICTLWGVFYFPAACAVAGYTKSIAAAINPSVGIDTIRHMGIDYVKVLAMSILIWICSTVTGIVFAVVLSPFDMPAVGNIPAQFMSSFVGFYFTTVFAVMLGLALYKNSEKLKLAR